MVQELAMEEGRAWSADKANDALQATIDVLSQSGRLDQVVPQVLKIVADLLEAGSCALFECKPTGEVFLRYWCVEGRTLLPSDLLRLDEEKFGLVRQLASGFEVPDSYLGGSSSKVIGPRILDHHAGTSVPEFDRFALDAGWELELNVGVAAQGVRAVTLCVYRLRSQPFTFSEISLTEALAKQLGLAVETSRLMNAVREAAVAREREIAAEERASELARINALLRESSEALTRAQTPQEIFEAFLLHVVSVMQGSAGGLYRRVQGTESELIALSQGGVIIPRANWEYFPFVLEDREVTSHDKLGLIARVVNGEDVWFPVDEAYDRWAPAAAAYHRQNGNRHIVFWPFRISGEVAGHIGIAFSSKPSSSRTQRETLQALSSQASLALELNAMTREVEQAAIARERQRAAEQRVSELARTNDALKQTLDVVAFESDLDKVLGQILTAITGQLNSPSSAIWLVDRETGRFSVRLIYDNDRIVNSTERVSGHFQCTWGVRRDLLLKTHIELRRPVAYQVEDLKNTHAAAYAFFRAQQVQTLLGIPLLIGSDIVGTLTVRFKEMRTLSQEELALAQAVAHQATMAIQITDLAKRAGETAIVKERNRLAREIHDTLAQGFTGILMQVGAIDQMFGSTLDKIRPNINAIQRLAQSSLAEARRSVGMLRPPPNRVSFTEAMRETIERVRLQTRAQVDFELQGEPLQIGEAVEDELLRIAGESLANALKHAEASRILIMLDFERDGVRLAVQDNGVGFDDVARAFTGSFGLIGMQERATRVAADLTIISEVGRGTEVIVRWTKPDG